MSLYDGIKDVAKVMQQADNIELYRQLLDLSSQALDMQAEIAKLREENSELKKRKSVEDRIERHPRPYITLKDDVTNIKFCSICWDGERVLIQMDEWEEEWYSARSTVLRCHKCKNKFYL